LSEDSDDDPVVVEIAALRERTAKLEERAVALERVVDYLKDRIEKLDSKVWGILVGVIVSILLQILLRVVP